MTQDGGGPVRTKCFPAAGWNLAAAAKSCDCCKSSPALLFCRTDSTFMCMACDAKVHAGAADHERVWMCEVCEQAPASVTCKADAASLCFACDRDIHSANPLSRRHDRVPVVPFFDTAESMVMKTAAAALLVPADDIFAAPPCQKNIDSSVADESGYITDNSWISSNPIVADKFSVETPDIKSVEFLFSDADQFLDFDNYQICSQPYSDSVVPVQTTVKPPVQAQSTGHQHMPENRFEIDFTRSNITSYTNSYTTPRSLSHSVSSSSLDVGVVPDGSAALSEISYPFSATISSSIDLSANLGNSQVVGMDREARVLRYREKRKNRKFEKTIRYASRKAYAETRPRIKGRFAKRTDSAESDTDGLFFSGAGSPVVPADKSSRYYSNSNYPILLNYICNN